MTDLKDSAPPSTAKHQEGIATGLADLDAPEDFTLVGKFGDDQPAPRRALRLLA